MLHEAGKTCRRNGLARNSEVAPALHGGCGVAPLAASGRALPAAGPRGGPLDRS